MSDFTRYVVGFAFDKDGEQIALIEKRRPQWQAGQLNGIGGKIERAHPDDCCHVTGIYPDCDQMNFDPCRCQMELPVEAMRREFREETSVDISDWKEFLVLDGPGFQVHFFSAFTEAVNDVETTTDETIYLFTVDRVLNPNRSFPLISNLFWIIPMALNMIYEPHIERYMVEQVNYGKRM